MKFFKLLLILLTTAVLIFSCSLPTQKDSQKESETEFDSQAWDDYRQEHVVQTGSGYLVEGDLKVSSLDEVKAYFARMSAIDSQRSTVHLNDDGEWDVWNETEKNNLTYTVDGFADNTAVRNLLIEACASWEAAADIDFIDITGTGQTPLFIVRPATAAEETANPYTEASAFFPHYFDRELVFYQRWLGYGSDEQLSIAKHELGHILGLRHEHIWYRYWEDDGSVTEQVEETLDPAELITAYDQRSIMFYDWKPGYLGDGDLSLYDIVGVMTLYSQKPVLPDGYYTIRSVYNDFYLEFFHDTRPYDLLLCREFNGVMNQLNQKWYLEYQPGGYYTLTSCYTGYLMRFEYPYIQPGIKNIHSINDMEYMLQQNPDGSYFLRPKNRIVQAVEIDLMNFDNGFSNVVTHYYWDYDDRNVNDYTLWYIEPATMTNKYSPVGIDFIYSELAITGRASDSDCRTSIRIDAYVNGSLKASTITDPKTREYTFDSAELFPENELYTYEIKAVDSVGAVQFWPENINGLATIYSIPAKDGVDTVLGSGVVDKRTIENGASYILRDDLKAVENMRDFASLPSDTDWSSRNAIVLDVNGDDRDDLFMQATSSRETSFLFISNNNGFTRHIMKDYANWGEHSSWANRIPTVLDVNGDGRDDLLMQWHDNSEDVKSMIFIASQDGSRFYGQDIIDFAQWGNNRSWSARIPTVLDVNGDGRDDLLMRWYNNDEDVKSMIFIASQDGSRFYGQNIIDFAHWGNNRSWSGRIPTVLDVNGDGNDDLLMQWHDDSEDVKSMIWIASQDGSRFYGHDIIDFAHWGNNWSWSARKAIVLDANGDGKDDLFMQSPSSSQGSVLFLSNGYGLDYNDIKTYAAWGNDGSWKGRVPFVLDVNGDDKDDLLMQRLGGDLNSMLFVSDGSGFDFYDIKSYANWGDNTAWSSRTPIILDIDGDDKDEIFLQWND